MTKNCVNIDLPRPAEQTEWDAQVDELVALLDSSLPTRDVADQMGLKYHQVYAMAKRIGKPVGARELLPRNYDFVAHRVQTMKPLEAVEYLLQILQPLLEAGEEVEQHAMSLGLSRYEGMLYTLLRDREGKLVPRDVIYGVLYGHRDDPPSEQAVDVHILNMRRKLPPRERIESKYGRGWRLLRDGAEEGETDETDAS